MLAVTYGDKTYNVDVKETGNISQTKSQGGTHRKRSNKKRSKPTRRIKR